MSQSTSNQDYHQHEAGILYVVGHKDVAEDEDEDINMQNITHPLRMDGLESVPIIKVSAGPFHALALSKEGIIYSWGDPQYGALGRKGNSHRPERINSPSIRHIRFKDIACGSTFSMALSSKGQLYTWGTFRGSKEIYGYLPHVKIQYSPRIIDKVSAIQFTSIAAGACHCLALDSNGYAHSWGCGEFNQLGIPGYHNRKEKLDLLPHEIALSQIVHIACGQFHSLAINKLGQVFAWGSNKFHQCGIMNLSTPTEEKDTAGPEEVPAPQLVPKFKYYADRDFSYPEIRAEFVSGKRPFDEIDSEITNDFHKRLKVSFEDQENMEIDTNTEGEHAKAQAITQPRPVSIAGGADHTIIQMSDGSLFGFGRNDHGQLGIPMDKASLIPGAIRSKESNDYYAIGIPLKNPWSPPAKVTKVISGFDHVLTVDANGQVWSYGSADHYQLGLYDTEDVFLPTPVESIGQRGQVIDGAANDAATYFIVRQR